MAGVDSGTGMLGRNIKSSTDRDGRSGLQKRLRERCLARVKKERAAVLAQLRSLGPTATSAPGGAAQVMESLAHSLIQQAQAEGGIDTAGMEYMLEDGAQLGTACEDEELSAEQYLELMRQVEEDVIAELLRNESEDDRQLIEYLEHERQEAAAAQQAAEEVQNATICPVCLRGPLRKHKNTFFCPCGMRLRIAQDQLSLEQLRNNVAAAFQEHGAACQGQAGCAVQSCGGYDMLVMACASCDFLNILA